MKKTNHADLVAAIELFEDELQAKDPDAAYSIGTITNSTHALEPRGRGVAVTVHAFGEIAWVKHTTSFLAAMRTAIAVVQQKAEQHGWSAPTD